MATTIQELKQSVMERMCSLSVLHTKLEQCLLFEQDVNSIYLMVMDYELAAIEVSMKINALLVILGTTERINGDRGENGL